MADRDGFDADEAVVALQPGIHATPWHPTQQTALPPTYKFCLLGASGAGKSSFAHALCSRSFDHHRPTSTPAQLFFRLTHDAREVRFRRT